MWCPCCLGNPWSPDHIRDLKAASKWFIAIVSYVDLLVFMSELVVGAIVPHGFTGLAPSTCTLGMMGGIFAPLIINRYQVYRLIIPMFLHGGFLHIIMNMYVQLLMGFRCEAKWGFGFTALVYFSSGIGGCLTSAVGSPVSVGVGASGAIVGLVGAQIAELTANWNGLETSFRQRSAGQLAFFLIILFLFGTSDQHVDNYAHFGGLVTGLLVGYSKWADSGICLCTCFQGRCPLLLFRRSFVLLLIGCCGVLCLRLFLLDLPDVGISCYGG